MQSFKKVNDSFTTILDSAAIAIIPRDSKPFLVETSKWGGEVFLSFELLDFDFDTKDVSMVMDKLVSTNGGVSHSCYLKSDKGTTDGLFEYDLTIAKKPLSNRLRFAMNTSPNLEFLPQPTDIRAHLPGVIVPQNVFGSYAVYVNKANNQYQTGKLCHIYALEVIDAIGKKIIAPITIDPKSGLLIADIDWGWLDSAVYPIVIDPTFGYTSKGATAIGGDLYNFCNTVSSSRYTASTGDTITSFSIYIMTTSSAQIDMAAYTWDGSQPQNRLAAAVTVSVATNVDAWINSGAVSQQMSNGVTYLVGCGNGSKAGGSNFYVCGDNAGTDSSHYIDPKAALPATWPSDVGSIYRISQYATYTEGASEPATGEITTSKSFGVSLAGISGKIASATSGASLGVAASGVAAKIGTNSFGILSGISIAEIANYLPVSVGVTNRFGVDFNWYTPTIVIRRPVRSHLQRALSELLSSITVQNGFEVTIRDVFNPPRNMEVMTRFPCINLIWGEETRDTLHAQGNNALIDHRLRTIFDVFLSSVNDPETEKDMILAAIQKCLGMQFTIVGDSSGQNAFLCLYAGSISFGTDRECPSFGISIEYDIWYTTRLTDQEKMIY